MICMVFMISDDKAMHKVCDEYRYVLSAVTLKQAHKSAQTADSSHRSGQHHGQQVVIGGGEMSVFSAAGQA